MEHAAFVTSALMGLGVPSTVSSDQLARQCTWEECHASLCACVLTACVLAIDGQRHCGLWPGSSGNLVRVTQQEAIGVRGLLADTSWALSEGSELR